jgi:hypothetical protein
MTMTAEHIDMLERIDIPVRTGPYSQGWRPRTLVRTITICGAHGLPRLDHSEARSGVRGMA